MATIFDVAKYILSKSGTMTTMKLQKLCYYSQAWNLAWQEEPLFNEEFQAWANGPVCRDLYQQHKGKFNISSGQLHKGNIANLNQEQKANIDIVLRDYGDKEPYWLSELTHMEYPWKTARMGVPLGEPSENVISKESMLMYYSGLIANE